MTEWIPTDKIPKRKSHSIWPNKFREFMNGKYTIAFLQFENIKDTLVCARALRNARTREGLTGDDIRITSNKPQLRVYVAKKLVDD